MRGIFRIKNQTAARSTQQFKKIIRTACCSKTHAVRVDATAITAGVAGSDINLVESGNGEAITPVGPMLAAIPTEVHSSIIGVVNSARRRRWHDKSLVISMRVIRLAPVRVPTRNLLPLAAAVRREMQIHAAADYVVGIR